MGFCFRARSWPRLGAGAAPGTLQCLAQLESLRVSQAMLLPLPSGFPLFLLVACARPTSYWHWCCSGRPPVSSPTRSAPRLSCYVAAPSQLCSLSFCVQRTGNLHQGAFFVLVLQIYFNARKGFNQAHPRSSTTGIHNSGECRSLSNRHLSALCDGVDLPSHAPHSDEVADTL